MHPRNPYKTPPNFRDLAEAYPLLKPCLQPNSSIDFKNEESQRRLTEAFLCRDFQLAVELPPNRLCPPVPNRLNYILWLEDVLEGIPVDAVRGLDIGTGATAIYPLLGCRKNASWSFLATDIDSFSLQHAQSNIQRNRLEKRIQLIATKPDAPIFAPLLDDLDARIAFTMCNPPFYASRTEVDASAEAKELEPNAVCTGADVEMITPGGESAFVCRMVEESLKIGTRCIWFTSMLGKMSSLSQVVQRLRAHSIDNYAVTELVQGTTRRWAIGWSFTDTRLPDSVARIHSTQLQSLMPPKNTLHQPFPALGEHLQSTLGKLLEGTLSQIPATRVVPGVKRDAFTVYAARNTWSRSARRKQMQEVESEPVVDSDAILVCGLRWLSEGETGLELEHQWVRGNDRRLFEGFASHVNRKLANAAIIT
ncbi:S-adenosyl-L-methionine-dependent methyltransferase [Mycena kentingensis (nom. inval.)]|nr:S-adenosyl-L-methionine-dependent methyltransferase [Mycena kentingensis (nom. inval.)]